MMLDRMKIALVAALVVASAVCPLSAMAQTVVYPAHLTEVINGWNSEDFTVGTDVPIVNPANCSLHDLYASQGGAPGQQKYYAAALTALANKMAVTIVVSNTQCYMNRPVLWSIAPGW